MASRCSKRVCEAPGADPRGSLLGPWNIASKDSRSSSSAGVRIAAGGTTGAGKRGERGGFSISSAWKVAPFAGAMAFWSSTIIALPSSPFDARRTASACILSSLRRPPAGPRILLPGGVGSASRVGSKLAHSPRKKRWQRSRTVHAMLSAATPATIAERPSSIAASKERARHPRRARCGDTDTASLATTIKQRVKSGLSCLGTSSREESCITSTSPSWRLINQSHVSSGTSSGRPSTASPPGLMSLPPTAAGPAAPRGAAPLGAPATGVGLKRQVRAWAPGRVPRYGHPCSA